MKLKYIVPPLNEGGGAVTDAGTIHITEIKRTLTKLTADLRIPFDLNECVLGSTGKAEYSGDIDLVIDAEWWNKSPAAFRETLAETFGKDCTAQNGGMVHLKLPIEGYDCSLQERLPRTGFVQVDFNFGNPEWEKFYHYSPGDKSGYKGAHRNLAIAAICAASSQPTTDEVDTFGRPLTSIRWKLSPNGFIKVLRKSVREKNTNVWTKKQVDTELDICYDPASISRILFQTPVATVDDLFSLETMIAAVDRYCGMAEKERIYSIMAKNFAGWKGGKNFVYPEEITKYME